jgi:hypothetical protein
MHWSCKVLREVAGSWDNAGSRTIVPSITEVIPTKAPALALLFAYLGNLERFIPPPCFIRQSAVVASGLKGALVRRGRGTRPPARKHFPALSRLFPGFASPQGAQMTWHCPRQYLL